MFDIHIHIQDKEQLTLIIKKLDKIMSDQTQLAADLQALTAQTEKAKAEIIAKVAELEAAITNAGNTTPEVDAALAGLKAAVQGVDDLNADAPPPPPEG